MAFTALNGLFNVFVASVRGFWCERSVKLNLCFILSAVVIGLPLNSMNLLRIRQLIKKYKRSFPFLVNHSPDGS